MKITSCAAFLPITAASSISIIFEIDSDSVMELFSTVPVYSHSQDPYDIMLKWKAVDSLSPLVVQYSFISSSSIRRFIFLATATPKLLHNICQTGFGKLYSKKCVLY